MWNCSQCNQVINPPRANCPYCNFQTNLPSHLVRAGEDSSNLDQRYQDITKICSDVEKQRLDHCEALIRAKQCVSINLEVRWFLALIADPSVSFANLHNIIRSGTLVGYSPDQWSKRKAIDNAVFGNDGENLCFGALNLGSVGVISYGPVCMILRTDKINARTSFTEQNSFRYFKGNLLSPSINIPLGVRALWGTVAKLAIAKHQDTLRTRSNWTESELATLLISSGGDKDSDDFIEAQIHLPLQREHIEKIIYARTSGEQAIQDKLLELIETNDRGIIEQLLAHLVIPNIAVEIM